MLIFDKTMEKNVQNDNYNDNDSDRNSDNDSPYILCFEGGNYALNVLKPLKTLIPLTGAFNFILKNFVLPE